MKKLNFKSTQGSGSASAPPRKKLKLELPLFRKNYTYISQQVSFDGDLTALENVVLDGKMHGNIRAAKHVSLGSTARFEGTIECETSTISGSVTGSISASKDITVCVPATIDGDLIAASVKIESGVVVNGRVISKPQDKKQEPAEDK